jgi:hypothetical protein
MNVAQNDRYSIINRQLPQRRHHRGRVKTLQCLSLGVGDRVATALVAATITPATVVPAMNRVDCKRHAGRGHASHQVVSLAAAPPPPLLVESGAHGKAIQPGCKRCLAAKLPELAIQPQERLLSGIFSIGRLAE